MLMKVTKNNNMVTNKSRRKTKKNNVSKEKMILHEK